MGLFKEKKSGNCHLFLDPWNSLSIFSPHDCEQLIPVIVVCYGVVVCCMGGKMNSWIFFIMPSIVEKKVYYVRTSYNKLGGQMLSPKFENDDVAIKVTNGKEWLGNLA